jgi:hypothetical protein
VGRPRKDDVALVVLNDDGSWWRAEGDELVGEPPRVRLNLDVPSWSTDLGVRYRCPMSPPTDAELIHALTARRRHRSEVPTQPYRDWSLDRRAKYKSRARRYAQARREAA